MTLNLAATQSLLNLQFRCLMFQGHAGLINMQRVTEKMTEIRKSFHGIAFFTNLTSNLTLIALLALGVFVNVNRFSVGDECTAGSKAVRFETSSWSVACRAY